MATKKTAVEKEADKAENKTSTEVLPEKEESAERYNPNNFKISKIMLAPSRKINLGNFETLEVNAGIEITFDQPQKIGSEIIQDAFAQTRKLIGMEFRQQVDAFGKSKKKETIKPVAPSEKV